MDIKSIMGRQVEMLDSLEHLLKNFGWKYHDGLWPYWDRDNSKHLEKDLQRISDNKFLYLVEDAE